MRKTGFGALLLVTTLWCFEAAAQAYYFQGYYTPTVLISPLRDDLVYTPVGMGIVTSNAGFRVHPITGRGDFHSGVDLAAKLNDPVYALLDGVVTRVGWRGALGVSVEIYNPYPNVRTIYGHLNAYSVLPGQRIQRGRVIGYAGCTGRSTGVHLHFTVIKEDTHQYIEPIGFLKTIPAYCMALKSARIRRLALLNSNLMRKPGFPSSRIIKEDLPPEGKPDIAPPSAESP